VLTKELSLPYGGRTAPENHVSGSLTSNHGTGLMKKVALIPARSGSVRVPDKNIYNLFGHPMLGYTISAALESKVFDEVLVVTDSKKYEKIAKKYGATVPSLRPSEISSSTSADIDWITWIFEEYQINEKFQIFSILRPTSPLRTKHTIQRAYDAFISGSECHSLRAVTRVSEHPGKMWSKTGEIMTPLIPFNIDGVPWHSNQTAKLPEVFVQNASLEIAWTSTVKDTKSISGHFVKAFETEGYEGLDINTQNDIWFLEFLIDKGLTEIPYIDV
jgi:N-acylneuraminate cytidylyltransferase